MPNSAMLSNKQGSRTFELGAAHKLDASGLFLPDKIVQAVCGKCLA
jgi:hypothetical protein